MKKPFPLRAPFYLALSFIFIGSLFRLQHWPYGLLLHQVGMALAGIFYLLMFIEVLFSKKAEALVKALWLVTYITALAVSFFIVPWMQLPTTIILGLVYLHIGRKHFVFTRKRHENIRFDSI